MDYGKLPTDQIIIRLNSLEKQQLRAGLDMADWINFRRMATDYEKAEEYDAKIIEAKKRLEACVKERSALEGVIESRGRDLKIEEMLKNPASMLEPNYRMIGSEDIKKIIAKFEDEIAILNEKLKAAKKACFEAEMDEYRHEEYYAGIY